MVLLHYRRRAEVPGVGFSTHMCFGEAEGTPDVPVLALCDDRRVPPTVMIVDDHAGFGLFARALLEAEGFDVIGEAGDGPSALADIAEWDQPSHTMRRAKF